jgi:hypothetical protein
MSWIRRGLLGSVCALGLSVLWTHSVASQDATACISTTNSATGALTSRGPSAGCYQLASSSPYAHAGTDGKDLGADVAAVMAATCGVVDGLPCSGGSTGTAPRPSPPTALRIVSH